MKKNTFVKGTIVGAIIGAIGGILLAPKSGKETQADIKRKVKGTYNDLVASLNTLSDELSGKVDNLKAAAKDLKGEAKEESQELIRRAEVLKQDLRIAGTSLAKNSGKTKDTAIKQVKVLMGEGSEIMKELERVTKRLASSAKDKAKEV
ncbi:YtxH domain-containing protein [Candidatus Saccharibacteria bacterium]|nr:YtxH domain-containing protein [Candidatus Saccharibacteria bacterium]